MLTALTGFCALIYYDTGRAKQLDITDMSLNAMNLQYHIELVDDSSDRLEVRGWAFIKGESIGKYDMHVVLKMDNSKNTYYQIPTKMIIRKDITHLFTEPKMENSPNYDKAGFNGRVWLNRLSRLPGQTIPFVLRIITLDRMYWSKHLKLSPFTRQRERA